MNTISSLLENYQTKQSNINSERAYWISLFVIEYNKGCEKKWAKTGEQMAIRLRYIPMSDIQWFYDTCKASKNFGKKMNYLLSTKKLLK